VQVSWSAADASGICSYEAQLSLNSGPYQAVPLSPASATSLVRDAPAQTNLRYRVRATDCAGNATAWQVLPAFTVREPSEQATAISYAGAWTRVAQAGAVGGFVKTTTAEGASATFRATATNFALVATRGPGRGAIRIFVDGTLLTQIDLQAPALQTRQLVWRIGFFPAFAPYPTASAHTVKVVNVGTAGRKRFDLDAFATLGP
jgi:hypothetical protein